MKRSTSCPRCGVSGREVAQVTVTSLVILAVPDGGYRFCATSSCTVAYYSSDGHIVRKDELRVRVGLKETDAPRLICYCFDVTVEDLEAEVMRTGTCTTPATISERIRAGLCSCETRNPEGVCCLGRLRAAADELAGLSAPPSVARESAESSHDCCKASRQSEEVGRP